MCYSKRLVSTSSHDSKKPMCPKSRIKNMRYWLNRNSSPIQGYIFDYHNFVSRYPIYIEQSLVILYKV